MDTLTPESLILLNKDSNSENVKVLSPVSDAVGSPPLAVSTVPAQREQSYAMHRRAAVLDIDTIGIVSNEVIEPGALTATDVSSVVPPAGPGSATSVPAADQEEPSPQKRFISKPRPRCAPRIREGAYVKGWSFDFTPLIELKLGKEGAGSPFDQKKAAATPKRKPMRLQKEARGQHGPAGISLEGATASKGFESIQDIKIVSAATRHAIGTRGDLPPERQRNSRSQSHAAMIDALLRKYLGSEVISALQTTTSLPMKFGGKTGSGIGDHDRTITCGATCACTDADPITTMGITVPYSGLKRLLQVKTAQDTALRALRTAPRTFRARPLPLTLLKRKVGGVDGPSSEEVNSTLSLQEAEIPPESGNDPLPPFRANPVPPSTSEPLYTLMMAESQLKQYGMLSEDRKGEDARVAPTAAEFEAAPLMKRPSTARARSLHSPLAGVAEDPAESNTDA